MVEGRIETDDDESDLFEPACKAEFEECRLCSVPASPQSRFNNLEGSTKEYETARLKISVTGRLGPGHRKILDAIFAEHIREKTLYIGAKVFVIDPRKIEKLVAVENDTQWLFERLLELKSAQIIIEDKKTGSLMMATQIVSEIREVERRVETPTGKLTGSAGELDTRPLYEVTVDAAWMWVQSAVEL